MVWIHGPKNLQRINPEPLQNCPFEDTIEFSDNGSAQVKQEVAEYLMNNHSYEYEISDNNGDK